MPRIRTIKPEFWDSPSVAKAGPWARLLFIALWNWADDHGRGTANLKELEGFAFPNDDAFTDRSGNTVHFRSVVAEVADSFGVMFYTVDGRPYYEIPSWDEHQRNERRSKQSKHPSAQVDGAVAEIPCTRTETPRTSGTGTGEQGNRGTGEQGTTTPSESHDRERAKRESSSTFSDGTPIPTEPPADDVDEPILDAELVAPTEIGTAATPRAPKAEPAHRTTVRMVLGDAGYPRSTIDQLARQVAKLAGKHPPDLIADALREWDRRPDVKPSFLSSVLGDVVKARRAQPTTGAATTKAQGWLDLVNSLPPDPDQKAIGQ